MHTVIYELNGVLPANKYLLGQYRWSYPVRLTGALLQIRDPASSQLKIDLEVGGVRLSVAYGGPNGQALSFVVGPGVRGRWGMGMGHVVPANTLVRWVADFDGPPEGAAGCMSITLSFEPTSVANVALTSPKLTVDYVNGSERTKLYDYDAASHTFTETVPVGPIAPTLSGSRARITRNGDASLQVNFTPATLPVLALQVLSGVVTANVFVERGAARGVGSVSGQPRLEFLVDGVRVAGLTMDGVLLVATLTEGPPAGLSLADDAFYARFEFWSSGVLTGTIGLDGLVALSIKEGF